MQTAKYRHTITIQKKKIVKNSYGEHEIIWEDDIVDYWAEVSPVRGKQYHFARQTQEAITHEVKMRYTTMSDGTRIKRSNARIIFEGERIFEIVSVINVDERNKDLELMCIEEV